MAISRWQLVNGYGLAAILLTSLFLDLNSSRGCTIGAFSYLSTRSRCPILWKNRDIANPDQAVYYFTDGQYRYLGLVYANDSTRVWAGINEKGFAIINSNSYNIGSGASNGPDDGELMKIALQRCASIGEFQEILDSTNLTGRTVPANFGVFDSTGEATIFEAGAYQYQRFDATKESLGFILRANFSMSGDSARRTGYARYLRAMELVKSGYQDTSLDAQYIFSKVARDIGGPDFNPYPLPFQDTFGSYPYGFLPTTASINRYRTRACVVLIGKAKSSILTRLGANPSDSKMRNLNNLNHFERFEQFGLTMWTILGEPCIGIPLPLILDAQSVPKELSGPGLPKICALTKSIRDYVYCGSDFGVNTFLLANIQKVILPLETEIFKRTEEKLNLWQTDLPKASEVLGFEESLAQCVVECYDKLLFNEKNSLPLQQLKIKIYPNPARKSVTIKGLPKSTVSKINVYDSQGRRVDEIKFRAGYPVKWLPKNLKPGTYFLILEPEPAKTWTKFLYLSNRQSRF